MQNSNLDIDYLQLQFLNRVLDDFNPKTEMDKKHKCHLKAKFKLIENKLMLYNETEEP